ncbi:hypothetical protein V2G26_003254 [Clonostachys chloroleuca]
MWTGSTDCGSGSVGQGMFTLGVRVAPVKESFRFPYSPAANTLLLITADWVAQAVSVYAGDRSFSCGDFGEKSFLFPFGGGITWTTLSHLPTNLSKSASWLAREPILGETFWKGANKRLMLRRARTYQDSLPITFAPIGLLYRCGKVPSNVPVHYVALPEQSSGTPRKLNN